MENSSSGSILNYRTFLLIIKGILFGFFCMVTSMVSIVSLLILVSIMPKELIITFLGVIIACKIKMITWSFLKNVIRIILATVFFFIAVILLILFTIFLLIHKEIGVIVASIFFGILIKYEVILNERLIVVVNHECTVPAW